MPFLRWRNGAGHNYWRGYYAENSRGCTARNSENLTGETKTAIKKICGQRWDLGPATDAIGSIGNTVIEKD